MMLEIHELIDGISTRETGDQSRFVLADPTREIVGDADIERAIALARQDVNVKPIIQGIRPLRELYPGSRIGAPASPSLVRDKSLLLRRRALVQPFAHFLAGL